MNENDNLINVIEDGIQNNKTINWERVPFLVDLTEEFIEKYKDKLNFKSISINQILSEEFIDRYKDELDWRWICDRNSLSEEFMRNHDSYLDWKVVSETQIMSEQFVVDYADKIDFEWFAENNPTILPFSFVDENKDIFNKNFPRATELYKDRHSDPSEFDTVSHVIYYSEKLKEGNISCVGDPIYIEYLNAYIEIPSHFKNEDNKYLIITKNGWLTNYTDCFRLSIYKPEYILCNDVPLQSWILSEEEKLKISNVFQSKYDSEYTVWEYIISKYNEYLNYELEVDSNHLIDKNLPMPDYIKLPSKLDLLIK